MTIREFEMSYLLIYYWRVRIQNEKGLVWLLYIGLCTRKCCGDHGNQGLQIHEDFSVEHVGSQRVRRCNINKISVLDLWISLLDWIKVENKRIERFCNKKVEPKSYKENDLVWKVILPKVKTDHFYGKWTLRTGNDLKRVLSNKTYKLENIEDRQSMVNFLRNIITQFGKFIEELSLHDFLSCVKTLSIK